MGGNGLEVMNIIKNRGFGDRRFSASGSWRELCPGSETRPPRERRRSCYIHDTPSTGQCLHCYSPANKDTQSRNLLQATKGIICPIKKGKECYHYTSVLCISKIPKTKSLKLAHHCHSRCFQGIHYLLKLYAFLSTENTKFERSWELKSGIQSPDNEMQ